MRCSGTKATNKITPEKFPDLKHKDIYIQFEKAYKVIPEEKIPPIMISMILQTKKNEMHPIFKDFKMDTF